MMSSYGLLTAGQMSIVQGLGQKWSAAVGPLFNNPLILGLISLQRFGHLGYNQFLGYTSEEMKILEGGALPALVGNN